MADIIAELFSKITGSECWPELIPFLCQRISQQFQDGFAKLAEICLYITAEIAPVLPDSMDHSVDQFIEMMKQSLHNPEPNIRLAAFKAIKSLALVPHTYSAMTYNRSPGTGEYHRGCKTQGFDE